MSDRAGVLSHSSSHVGRLYRELAFIAPFGSLSAGLTLVWLSWDHMEHDRMLAWLGVLAVVCAWVAIWLFHHRGTYDLRSIPLIELINHGMLGTMFGIVPLIDLDAFRSTPFFHSSLLACFAVSAGVVMARSVFAQLAFVVIVPMWAIASVALVLVSSWFMVAAVALFVALSFVAISGSTSSMHELLRLQQASQRQVEAIAMASRTDSLTGLSNRSHIVELLRDTAVDQWLLFLDLDRFKNVNDRLGHPSGDEVLATIGARLLDLPIAGATVARIGGDEFLIIVDRGAIDSPDEIGSQLLEVIEEPVETNGVSVRVSASVGISHLEAGADPLVALARADQALYAGKRNGRRQMVRYSRELGKATTYRVELEADLQRAIASGEIVAWCQPVVDLKSAQPVGVELLARWIRPDGSTVAPNLFIPIAADTGLLPQMTTNMVDAAAELLATLAARPTTAALWASVNVAPTSLGDGWLIAQILESFRTARAPVNRLVVELTEGDLIGGGAAEVEIDALEKEGVTIALDDFGSGYSSLSQLIRLPIGLLKLDKVLIDPIGDEGRSDTVVRAIASAAAELDIPVLAEGIERLDQLPVLRSLGVQFGQGFALGRPSPIEEFVQSMHLRDEPSSPHSLTR